MSTVLIVEDDFAIMFVAESTLRIEGYETVAAATRKHALAILRSDQEVDVLFTDIKLRGEKRAGLELAEKAVELRPEFGVRVYDRRGGPLAQGCRQRLSPEAVYVEPIDQRRGPIS